MQKLDKNGYAPSIMPHYEGCFVCGRQGDTARHEIFHGPYRSKSKALGLWIRVCPSCHDAIHGGREGLDGLLKRRGRETAQSVYGWTDDEFRYLFGKLY